MNKKNMIKEGLSPICWILVVCGLAFPPIGGLLLILFGLLGLIDLEF